jgi:hypothetical protein
MLESTIEAVTMRENEILIAGKRFEFSVQIQSTNIFENLIWPSSAWRANFPGCKNAFRIQISGIVCTCDDPEKLLYKGRQTTRC